MASAALGLAMANSLFAQDYKAMMHAPIGGLDLLHWINDGLMTFFFLLVGLEIKREMVEGQLDTWPRRALPLIAAFGGMFAPAVIFMAINFAHPENWRGSRWVAFLVLPIFGFANAGVSIDSTGNISLLSPLGLASSAVSSSASKSEFFLQCIWPGGCASRHFPPAPVGAKSMASRSSAASASP
jgi:Na+/H+ antiporter NhaA